MTRNEFQRLKVFIKSCPYIQGYSFNIHTYLDGDLWAIDYDRLEIEGEHLKCFARWHNPHAPLDQKKPVFIHRKNIQTITLDVLTYENVSKRF